MIGFAVGLVLTLLGGLLLWLAIREGKTPNSLPGTSGRMGALMIFAIAACVLIGIGVITMLTSGAISLFAS